MYSTRAGLILGFHGCDESVAIDVVKGNKELRRSGNDYDWLGNGVYFWENNYNRALEYATFLMEHPSRSRGKIPIEKPAVLGAVIDLGYCLDLLDSSSLNKVNEAYKTLKKTSIDAGWELPENSGGHDLRLRRLDCAVIQTAHLSLKEKFNQSYDSVRGMFSEGKRLYTNSGFRKKDHVQLCICNPNCIKGYFLPRTLNSNHERV